MVGSYLRRDLARKVVEGVEAKKMAKRSTSEVVVR